MGGENEGCWMCESSEVARTHELKEMMYGTKQAFEYRECGECGSLQIANVPANMAGFYPSDYYSFSTGTKIETASRYRVFLRGERAKYSIYGTNLIGRMISLFGRDYFDYPWEWFRLTSVMPQSKILDVGCGDGKLLASLRNQGFTNLIGVDPFRKDSVSLEGFAIRNCPVFELDGSFDLVMAHHSLEHMPNVDAALKKMRDLCKAGGYLLVRLPVLGYSWEHYGAYWVELDAPRHLFIPSIKGFNALVARIGGLRIEKIAYDTSSFELSGSELYKRGIPLRKSGKAAGRFNLEMFSSDEMQKYSRFADELNATGRAGRATFYIKVTK